MSDTALLVLGALELAGLVGLFALVRRAARRRAAGMGRDPRPARIVSALLGLAVVIAFPVLMFLSIMNPTIRSERQHERLVQTGTRATATITHIAETGTVINRRPEVQVSVTVQPQDAPAFRSQSTWAFSVSDIQRYRVGTEVHVFFDPEDHEAVAVVGVARSADEEEPLR